MCGLYGVIGELRDFNSEGLKKILFNRGPDDYGSYIDKEKHVFFAHNRLSIIDLSDNSHQPITDPTGNYILIFNGEIYNYKELRSELVKSGVELSTAGDSEVVLRSYILWGKDCLKYFRGMFSFAVYDIRKREVFLARDRFGIKPLLYSQFDNKIVFSSELKLFSAIPGCSCKLNKDAVGEYFKYGAVQQPLSIMQGVYSLMPGHYMSISVDNISERRIDCYYDLVEQSCRYPQIDSYEAGVLKVREKLEEAAKYHVVSDVDVGAFLSGGVDSTAVVGLMSKYIDSPIHTFSLGFSKKMDVFDERDIARNSALKFNTIHHDIAIDDSYLDLIFDDFVNSLDQPSIDGLNTYIVSKEASNYVKVVLSGLGGDEIFAGYNHFGSIRDNRYMTKNIVSILGEYLHELKPSAFTAHFKYAGLDVEEALEEKRIISRKLGKIIREEYLPNNNRVSVNDSLSVLQKLSKLEIDHYMLNTLLRDCDVLSMANSLEVRPLLLDHELVEIAFFLPDVYKIRNNTYKAVLIDAVKDMLPNEVINRRKTGFELPFSSWMNGVLIERAHEALNFASHCNILKPNFISDIKKRANRKKLVRSDWSVFIFFAWLQKNGLSI